MLDLRDYQRALVWIDGRLRRLLGSALFACWIGGRKVRTEVIDIRNGRFDHLKLRSILKPEDASKWLDVCKVAQDAVGVLYIDGTFTSLPEPGLYAFSEDAAEAMRSQTITAELLAENLTLIRLRELEVSKKIASNGEFNIILSDKRLADKVGNLL